MYKLFAMSVVPGLVKLPSNMKSWLIVTELHQAYSLIANTNSTTAQYCKNAGHFQCLKTNYLPNWICTLMRQDGFLPKENNVSSKFYDERDFDFTIVNFPYRVATFLLPCLLCITTDMLFCSCGIFNRELCGKLPNQVITSEFLWSPSWIDDRCIIESQCIADIIPICFLKSVLEIRIPRWCHKWNRTY